MITQETTIKCDICGAEFKELHGPLSATEHENDVNMLASIIQAFVPIPEEKKSDKDKRKDSAFLVSIGFGKNEESLKKSRYSYGLKVYNCILIQLKNLIEGLPCHLNDVDFFYVAPEAGKPQPKRDAKKHIKLFKEVEKFLSSKKDDIKPLYDQLAIQVIAQEEKRIEELKKELESEE